MADSTNKKIFVLDTNVILHDYKSIYNFQENDIVIPIVVLEELDKFKRGNDQINFHAREFARELDGILGGDILGAEGVSLGAGHGNLRIQTGVPFSDKMKISFSEDIPDHRILATAEYVTKQHPERKVVLVTKDMNLRVKAKALGVLAQDYLTDQVKDLDTSIGKSISTLDGVPDELIASLYEQGEKGVPVEKFFPGSEVKGNHYYVLKSGSGSALACYDPDRRVVRKVEKLNTFGIYPKNAEQTFALDALMNPNIPLVALSGKAGTGKTLLALAAALQQSKSFEQICRDG